MIVTGGPVNSANVTVQFDGVYAQKNVAPLTANTVSATIATTQEGDLVPGAVRRRAPQRRQHERPARQGAAHPRQRRRLLHEPCRQPVPGVPGHRRPQPSRDLRDGLPQPVPDPGRRPRRRLRHRLLARLQRARELPRAGGHGPRRGGAQGRQLRLAALLRAEAPVLPLELQHLQAAGPDARGVRVRRPRPRAAEPLALEHGPDASTRRASPAASTSRRSPSRTSGTPTATTPTRRWARPAWRTTTGPAAAARSSSPSCTRPASPRTARLRTATTPTTRARRSSRRTTTAPSSSASSTWTRCARSASTRTTRSSRSTGSSTAARRSRRPRRSRSSATTRWTCSSAPTAATTC